MSYTFIVPETAGNLDWRPELQRRTPADRRFFFVRAPRASFNGRALVGERLRSPVSFAPVRQPRHVPGHPNWRWELGYQASKGGRTMRHISARSEQQQSIIEIIRAALRDAATAPTIIDALDVTGEALRRLAEMAQAEART